MYGLDLFSGIGGLSKALEGYVRPIAYCEIDDYCRRVLLSRMATGDIPVAPICDDVRELEGTKLPHADIIYGGFPCQDISVAGKQKGLGGERSGLFFEIIRLAREIGPEFIFLENVPNIRTKGLGRVLKEMGALGYDCRWGLLSAADVGANHKRERWFLLAHAASGERSTGSEKPRKLYAVPAHQKRAADNADGPSTDVSDAYRQGQRIGLSGGAPQNAGQGTFEGSSMLADSAREQGGRIRESGLPSDAGTGCKAPSDAMRAGLERQREQPGGASTKLGDTGDGGWWAVEPNVGRVANGVPKRVDRLRALGNAVVPAQAREAFERLMGLK